MIERWPYQNLDPANPQFTPPEASPTEGVLYQIAISEEWKWILTTLVNRIVDPGAWDAPKEDQEQASLHAVELSRLLWEAAVVDCQDVADCVETNPDVQNQIQIIVNSGNDTSFDMPINNVPYYPMPEATYVYNQVYQITANPGGCDDSKTYGAAKEIVTYLLDDITTVFELVELLSDPGEALEIVTDAIGFPPANLVGAYLKTMDFVLETGQALWEFSNNSTNVDRLTCAIWCEFKDCSGMSMQTVYDVITSEFDTQTGRNITSLSDFIDIIDEIFAQNWLDYTLLLAFMSAWCAFMRFVQNSMFASGVRSLPEWVAVLKVGYTNGDAGYLLCDPCAVEPPCGFYVVNFINLGVAGLPVGWMPNPPANLAGQPGFENLRWANERGSNETLRAANYPSYGLQDEEFVRLCAAYDLGDNCTLLNLTTDFNYAAAANTKQISAYALQGDYDWDNKILIDNDSVQSPGTTEPGIAWSGNIETVRYVLLVSNGVYNAGDGTVSLRFFRVNK